MTEEYMIMNETVDEFGRTAEESEQDEQFQKSMEFMFEVVLLSIFGFLGIIGNTAAIFVFSRQNMQLKFHRLMTMLAVFDLFYIVLSLMLFTIPQVSPEYKTSGAHYYVLPKALPLAQIMLTGSIYSTLAISFERYLTVCHPFFAISHKWTSRRYVIPIVAFSFLYNCPKFFELVTGYEMPNNTNSLNVSDDEAMYEFTIEPTDMRINEYYIKIYCIWMNFIFMGVMPFCLLIILNSLTLRSLIIQSQSALSREFSHTKKNEIALAKVSLSIACVFILCHSVKWIPNLYELWRLTGEDKREWPPWVESVTHISHFLMTLNSSVNFYFYCVKHYNIVGRLCGNRSDSSPNTVSYNLGNSGGPAGGGAYGENRSQSMRNGVSRSGSAFVKETEFGVEKDEQKPLIKKNVGVVFSL